MASTRTCDSCQAVITDANPIVIKLFLTPVKPGQARANHGEYNAHADIGKCCAEKTLGIKWQKRKTRKVKSNGRKLRPADTVPKG